jgi:hypothetical protein
MSVTYDAIIQVDDFNVSVQGHSDVTAPVTLRMFQNGIKVGEYESLDGYFAFTVNIMPGDSDSFEVLDKSCSIPALAFPGRATLNWRAKTDANKYRIEEYVSAAWTERITINSNGSGSYVWTSRYLEDVTTHQFRIIPIDASGNDGTALTFSMYLARVPDVPLVTYTYDSGTGKVTIAAA